MVMLCKLEHLLAERTFSHTANIALKISSMILTVEVYGMCGAGSRPLSKSSTIRLWKGSKTTEYRSYCTDRDFNRVPL
jgi:hypothetical protein